MNIGKCIFEARRVGVPLVYITTPDPEVCIQKLEAAKALNNISADATERNIEGPIITWDIVQGMVGRNDAGRTRLASCQVTSAATKEVNAALGTVAKLQTNATVFFFVPMPEAVFKSPVTVQVVWSLRDILKANGTMLVFIGTDCDLPDAIAHDVMKVRDAWPNRDELKGIVLRQYESLKSYNDSIPELADEEATRAALGMQGLSPFSAETAIAMSFGLEGINFETLREQRYTRIETNGLKVWKGGERFSDLKGIDGAANFLLRLTTSPKKRVGAVFFFDEIEKKMSGVEGGDRSGTSDEYLAQILTYMEDNKVPGALLFGNPGCGKTEICKALGNEAGILTMAVDLGQTKDRFIGASERNLARVLDIATAVSGGVPLFLASCNSSARLPTSLMRRFTNRLYFGLPSRQAKDQIWKVKMQKYALPEQSLPDDDQWTGYEIQVCCERAYLFDCSIIEAAQSVIPVAKANPKEVVALQQEATGRYLDAETGLVYAGPQQEAAKLRNSGRRTLLQ